MNSTITDAQAEAIRQYLAGRGVTPEAISTFRLGYAPDNFNAARRFTGTLLMFYPTGLHH